MRAFISRNNSRLQLFIRVFLHNPKDAIYNLLRFLFRRLPGFWKATLRTPAVWTVQKLKRDPAPRTIGLPGDLSWSEFQSSVLSKKEQYKGIFIQEIIIDWAVPLFQRPQHLATALGKLGYLVLYRTANNLADNVNGFRKVAENVWITNCEEVDQLSGAIRSIYSTSFYFDVRALINKMSPERFSIYEYIDHIDPMISGNDNNIRQLYTLKEFAFNGGVDYVVASSRKLEEEAIAALGRDRVLYLPNGVDVTHYRNAVHETTPISTHLLRFREQYSNIVGYFGAIAPWLWYDMISELARNRSDLGFVFIGPDYQLSVNRLPSTRNFLHLGMIDYNILPAYARLFDVCFIPFAPGEIAHSTSPLKLFEYFALEKPVVTTSFMDECVAFLEVFHGDSFESLSNAIDNAIAAKKDPSFRARLAQLANQNSWEGRAKQMETVFWKTEASTIRAVQDIISQSYSEDGNYDNYYDKAYKLQENYYWMPVPGWISRLKSIKSVIDIGSAYGTLLLYTTMNHRVDTKVAIDPVEYMSPSLKNKYKIMSYKIDVERESLENLGKFDLVIFTEVIEHLNFHPLSTLSKIRELMHSESYLVLSTPDAEEWGRVTKYYNKFEEMPVFSGEEQEWIDGHIYQYTKEELDSVFESAGFRVEQFSYSPGVHKRHLCYLLKKAY